MIFLITNWERIKRELDSLNLFFSAIVGRSDPENNFRTMGFEEFVQVKFKDPYSEKGLIEAIPDYVLLRDNHLCFVEVKSGRNIDKDHIEQSNRNSSFSIEGLRRSFNLYLERSVPITEFDSIFVFDKKFLDNCLEIEKCAENLEKIMNDSVVLCQERGRKLTFWEGSNKTSSDELNNVLKDGIQLDYSPKNEIMIVNDPEIENVIVYLIRKFLDRFKDKKEIVMSVSEIFNEFIPKNISCSHSRIKKSMDILRQLDAATLKQGEDRYRVQKSNVGNLMNIPNILLEKNAEDIINDGHMSLDDF